MASNGLVTVIVSTTTTTSVVLADTELMLDVKLMLDAAIGDEVLLLGALMAVVTKVLGPVNAGEVAVGKLMTDDEALVVELARPTGNGIVGVVGRPSAFPERVGTELVLAAGTTEDKTLEDVATAPATVW